MIGPEPKPRARGGGRGHTGQPLAPCVQIKTTYRRRTWWFSSSSTSRGPDGVRRRRRAPVAIATYQGRRVRGRARVDAQPSRDNDHENFYYHEWHENTNIGCVWPHTNVAHCAATGRRVAATNSVAGTGREPRLTDGNAAALLR